MGGDLTGAKTSATYKSIIQVGGTANAVVSSSYLPIEDGVGTNIPVFVSSDGLGFKIRYNYLSSSDPVVLTYKESGSLIIWNSDSNAAPLQLPDSGTAINLGSTFTFFNADETESGNKTVVCTDTTNEKFLGYINQYDMDSSSALAIHRAVASTNYSKITLNGTTTGGFGSYFTVTAVTADRWIVSGVNYASGSVATPFTTS